MVLAAGRSARAREKKRRGSRYARQWKPSRGAETLPEMSHKITSKQRPGQGSHVLEVIPKALHMEMRTDTPRLTAHGPHSPRIVGLSLHAGASMRSIGDPTAMNTVTTAASRRREGGASGSHQWSMVHGAWCMVHRQSSIVHRPSSMGKHRVPVFRKRGREAPALLLPVCR